MIDILICAFFIIIFWLQDCVRADVPLLLSVRTDVLTPVGGDCGKGGVALRGCALLLSLPFFPPSRPSFQPVVRPSQPVRPPASPHTGLRYFYFLFFCLDPCDNLFSSYLLSCNVSPAVISHLLFCSPSWSSSRKTCFPSLVATPHCARHHFGQMDIARETFPWAESSTPCWPSFYYSLLCLFFLLPPHCSSRLWHTGSDTQSLYGCLCWTGVYLEAGVRNGRPSWSRLTQEGRLS